MTTKGSSQFGIKDNHSRGNVSDFIKAKIASGSDLSIVSAYFTDVVFQHAKRY
ncbi:MAG: hypothetical protein AB7U63_08110 [Porticoccaceae bacterium]